MRKSTNAATTRNNIKVKGLIYAGITSLAKENVAPYIRDTTMSDKCTFTRVLKTGAKIVLE